MPDLKRFVPKAMHHTEKDSVMVYGPAEEKEYAAKGYTDQYTHKEYPKWVDGKLVKEPAK